MAFQIAQEEPGQGSTHGVQLLRAEEGEDLRRFHAVTGVDPGGTTGIATVWFDRELLLNPELSLQKCLMAWEAELLFGTDNYQALQSLRWLRDRAYGPHALAIEDFIMKSQLPGREVLSPVRIGHKIEWQVWRGIRTAGSVKGKRTFEVQWQSPGDAKGVAPDNRLKLFGMYTPGPDHARDATRHCLLWLRKYRTGLLNPKK
jgi:hypothetical protein